MSPNLGGKREINQNQLVNWRTERGPWLQIWMLFWINTGLCGKHITAALLMAVIAKKTFSLKYLATLPPACRKQLVSHHEISTKAEIIHQKFGQLFDLFSTVDSLLSHDLPVAETTIPKIDKAISGYMKFYRRNFPGENTLPKQHILEHHCSAWVQTWGFGMSLMGDQGGEQLHATINALKRRAWEIKKERDQLKFLMKQHHT